MSNHKTRSLSFGWCSLFFVYDTNYMYELEEGNGTHQYWFTTPSKVGHDVPHAFGLIDGRIGVGCTVQVTREMVKHTHGTDGFEKETFFDILHKSLKDKAAEQMKRWMTKNQESTAMKIAKLCSRYSE
nr:purple acid phosphatase 2 isoform X1 [Tanacetum cinerariifolium]